MKLSHLEIELSSLNFKSTIKNNLSHWFLYLITQSVNNSDKVMKVDNFSLSFPDTDWETILSD